MNETTLSVRLQTVLNFIPKDAVFADIGTDHAYLPIAAIRSGVARRAIAADVRNGPWKTAKQHIERAGFEAQIEVRLGDGLDVIEPGEVELVTICGMGGPLIRDILNDGDHNHKLKGVRRLVLQPNIGEFSVRRWLRERGWQIVEEQWIEEDSYMYPVICADAPQADANDQRTRERTLQIDQMIICPEGCSAELKDAIADIEWQDRLGWYNLVHPTRSWWKKWSREWNKGEQIIASLQNAQSDESRERLIRMEFEQLILGEVLSRWKPLSES